MIQEHLRRIKAKHFFSIQESISFLVKHYLWIIWKTKIFWAIYYNINGESDHYAYGSRKWALGVKARSWRQQSRSYNSVTRTCEVSTNLSQYLLPNYSFYFVLVQHFSSFFVYFFHCRTYGSFLSFKVELTFCHFQLSVSSKFY